MRVGVLEHVGAGKGPGLFGEVAGLIHGTEHGQPVLFAGVEVVHAVAGGGVHQARAGFGGDVVAAQYHRAGALQQGMAVEDPLQLCTFHAQQRLQLQAQAGLQALHQIGRHHQVAVAGSFRAGLADGVAEVGVDRYRQVGGQGPGGGGPDGHSQLGAGQAAGGEPNGSQLAGEGLGELVHRKGHIHAR